MSNYDEEYFYLRRPGVDDKLPQLQADQITSALDYSFTKLPLGAPLVFHNAWKERNLEEGIQEFIGDVLFEGSDLAVCSKIREKLLHRDIPNLHMHPSIYIDDRNKRHEDYWYLTFTARFDCWDRKTSSYNPDNPLIADEMALYGVRKFRLDKELLDRTPLDHRLLFKMGGARTAFVTVHQSLLSTFNVNGGQVQKITDY